jgi:hypothetical protein
MRAPAMYLLNKIWSIKWRVVLLLGLSIIVCYLCVHFGEGGESVTDISWSPAEEGQLAVSPNRTLLRTLSLTSKDSARRTLDLMRCRENERQREREWVAKRALRIRTKTSLCKPKPLTAGFYFSNAHKSRPSG